MAPRGWRDGRRAGPGRSPNRGRMSLAGRGARRAELVEQIQKRDAEWPLARSSGHRPVRDASDRGTERGERILERLAVRRRIEEPLVLRQRHQEAGLPDQAGECRCDVAAGGILAEELALEQIGPPDVAGDLALALAPQAIRDRHPRDRSRPPGAPVPVVFGENRLVAEQPVASRLVVGDEVASRLEPCRLDVGTWAAGVKQGPEHAADRPQSKIRELRRVLGVGHALGRSLDEVDQLDAGPKGVAVSRQPFADQPAHDPVTLAGRHPSREPRCHPAFRAVRQPYSQPPAVGRLLQLRDARAKRHGRENGHFVRGLRAHADVRRRGDALRRRLAVGERQADDGPCDEEGSDDSHRCSGLNCHSGGDLSAEARPAEARRAKADERRLASPTGDAETYYEIPLEGDTRRAA